MVRIDLDRPPANPDVYLDEFNGSTLDAAWTVIDGTSGTVALTGTTGGVYDLATRPGWLMMQPDTGDNIILRRPFTLGDGQSIIAAFSITLNASEQSGITDSYLDCGIEITTLDDDLHEGEWVSIHLDSEVNGWRIWAGGGNSGGESGRSTPAPNRAVPFMAQRFYFRILRSGLDYYPSWSGDGSTWFPFSAVTLTSAPSYLWLFTTVVDSIPDPKPICSCDWIRIGGAGIDPW